MKFSFFASLLLFTSIAFAQLTVTGNSFIFVDGDGFTPAPDVAPIYVEDEVVLTDAYVDLANPGSNIYLRNGAQLIQGGTASANSGDGTLSVYQTGTANQWAYNYWCLPVGNNSLAVGNEDARVQLLNDVTGLTTANVANFTTGHDGSASPLTISSRWLWTLQASNQYMDWFQVGATGGINPGLGFTMKGNGTTPTESQLYDFRGKPNNGTITNTIAAGEFTLVGNPYPSAIDSAAFIHDPSNVNEIVGTIYYWEHDMTVVSHYGADQIGGYAEFTINAAGTVSTSVLAEFSTYDYNGDFTIPLPGPTVYGTKQAYRYIPIGQGFMVEGTATPVTNTVSVKNEHRVFEKEGGTNSFFFRNSNTNDNADSNTGIQYQENGLSIVPSDYKRFRLNVDFTVNEAQYTRQLVLNFHDTATFGHDRGLELHRAENLSSDAYFEQDNDIFSGLAYPFTEALTIPVSIDIEQQQPLRFRIFDIQNFDESQGIYLHDIVNDTYVDLRNQDYELNIDAGNYTDRFEVVFTTQGALGIDEFDVTSLTIRQNNNSHELTILNPNGLDVKTITLYDVAGKRVLNSKINAVSDHYNLSTSSISDGVYVVNVASKSSTTVKSQKIIVKN